VPLKGEGLAVVLGVSTRTVVLLNEDREKNCGGIGLATDPLGSTVSVSTHKPTRRMSLAKL
jgi:hypothetical protein